MNACFANKQSIIGIKTYKFSTFAADLEKATKQPK